jgi:SAM-dependent methyltransferase
MNGDNDSGLGDAVHHYDKTYFEWQREIGRFGVIASRFKYAPHIKPTDRVVDFGSGGGYLLAALTCAVRIGVEVNPSARDEAARNGITCVRTAAELPDDYADVIISNSCLEHVEHPLAELRVLYTKVRPGGTIVISVPNETLGSRYRPGDINQHLYCWSPMTLGNLLTVAGFRVQSVSVSRLMCPPNAQWIYRLTGERGFRAMAAVYRWLRLALYPLKAVDIHADVVGVAIRPEQPRSGANDASSNAP